MKKFYIEVEVYDRQALTGQLGRYVWKKLRSTYGGPYEFKTAEAAIKMARMCYPEHQEKVRIVCE